MLTFCVSADMYVKEKAHISVNGLDLMVVAFP